MNTARVVGSGLQRAGVLRGFKSCCSTRRCVPATCALLVARRGLIEHSTDPRRWRSVENEEVRRQHPGGVSLGSTDKQKLELEAEVKQRRVRGEVEDARYTAYVEVGVLAMLITLSYITYLIPADPSPQYTPYIAPDAVPDATQIGAQG